MPPTGFKRSRALWDNARRENEDAPASDKYMRVLRAVLYELQPVRFDELDTQTWIHRCRAVSKSVVSFTVTTVPSWSRIVLEFCRTMTAKQWMMVVGVVVYYGAVRWIHYALEAGPVVIILTALVAIFTVGLGDNENNDGLSAYSAFNKGFQQLMGSVDAEALLQQHVGGAMAMPMNNFGRDDNEREGARNPPARHERRRQQQQQEEEDDEDGRQQEQPPDDDSDSEEDDDDDEDDAPAHAQPRGRTTGKKARRRNLELRREMKRQREAAQAMGFGGQQQHDVVAMQRLVEDQVMFAADEADNE
jgi:hypothetical protein